MKDYSTLFENVNFLMFNRQYFFLSLYPWLLVLPVLSGSKSCCLSAWSMSFNILYVSTILALNRRYSSDGRPRIFKRSLYGKCAISLTSFVALLWTFSIAMASFLNTMNHTLEAYSKFGLTKDLYSCKNISLFIFLKVLRMIPRVLFAFEICEYILNKKRKVYQN